MSIAGIRSNRGDIYQTLIALDWALIVISNPEYEWLEVDSINYEVDDIVIGKTNGNVICCQCKKNEPDFKAWSVAELADEMIKASHDLENNKDVSIRYYSRDSFGALAKLREFSTSYSTQAAYKSNLTKPHKKTDQKLAARVTDTGNKLTTYEFLNRTSFIVTNSFDDLEASLLERLRQMASNSKAAYSALRTALDDLGGNVGVKSDAVSLQYRLTKSELIEIIKEAGAFLTPPINKAEILKSFHKTSMVGRSWTEDISGINLTRSIVREVTDAIHDKTPAILITGPPGSGKTCVMLSIQKYFENRSSNDKTIIPLFIQAREFADLKTQAERQEQGLAELWVEQGARLSEDVHLIVLIDSLDVLSISREHAALTYFLAQIDQLLVSPNVTVVTTCRDFDRKFDGRIAVRHWDREFHCNLLDWEVEVAPLLEQLNIAPDNIDMMTRTLIRNPRDLALYTELAMQNGSFTVVNSQTLAEKYLDIFVLADADLGDQALQAMEAMANEMLLSRSLSIPHQRFEAQLLIRKLCSLNVVIRNNEGRLAFGHQTLLDVLVVSSALRKRLSLNQFIKGLPPVPFIRPSIRTYALILAGKDNNEFRKQMRATLTGNSAFHIRRLVAEIAAEQIPNDKYWPLIRDLRDNHRDVFNVIYSKAMLIEWHYFWLKYVVPQSIEERDREALNTHARRISRWINEDTAAVMEFWTTALQMDWVDTSVISEWIAISLPDLNDSNLPLAVPMINLLVNLPKPEHSNLGRTIVRSISHAAVTDETLWAYIVGNITDRNVRENNIGYQLNCMPHHFGDSHEGFLDGRMSQSSELLELALTQIEQWGQVDFAKYNHTKPHFHAAFLSDTSYNDAHTKVDLQSISNLRVLMDSIENAVHEHAQQHTNWWQNNRERLAFSHEGTLRYFAICAFRKFPTLNDKLIGQLLSEKSLLESDLSYELTDLTNSSFIFLDSDSQTSAINAFQSIYEEFETEGNNDAWILKKRASYISAVPNFLRTNTAQVILDTYERQSGKLILEPSIGLQGGNIGAPFSYDIFLTINQNSLVQLLSHYTGYSSDFFEDFLVGGESEVGFQLREASSRSPKIFLKFLVMYWTSISIFFRTQILEGVTVYMACRHGNLQPNKDWKPTQEPNEVELATQILDELERNFTYWQSTSIKARALDACANVIFDFSNAERMVFLSIGYGVAKDREVNVNNSNNSDTFRIKTDIGIVAEALMKLLINLQDNKQLLPELLIPTLDRFASNKSSTVRSTILNTLPYLHRVNPELGWRLFGRVMHTSEGLWRPAERFLYYSYRRDHENVIQFLKRIHTEGNNKDAATWGRISALCELSSHIDPEELINDLISLDSIEAWKSAASVWTHEGNIRRHRSKCMNGIEAFLKLVNFDSMATVKLFDRVFRETTSPIEMPVDLIQMRFSAADRLAKSGSDQIYGFAKWLYASSQRNSETALILSEIYLKRIKNSGGYFHDTGHYLSKLLTKLFTDAEEKEESDNGEMLKRVVLIQDLMLSMGIESIDEWLSAAERP